MELIILFAFIGLGGLAGLLVWGLVREIGESEQEQRRQAQDFF